MTLKETITQELLDAVEGPAGLDEVFRRHGRSKGPLYSALAEATAILTERIAGLSRQSKETEDACLASQERRKALQRELADLEKAIVGQTKELAVLNKGINEKGQLLDRAKALGGLGFGPDELARLRAMLVKLAASQGAKPEETVALFFQEVDRYQAIVSLELGVKRAEVAASKAKAETERWQAEAKAAEVKAKARKASIDVTERLLAQGVKEPDLPQWMRILAKAGVSPEGLAQALEQHVSLEKLCQERRQQVRNLDRQAKELTSQVKALTEERQQVSAAIGAVRDEALAAVQSATGQALKHIETLAVKGKEYAELERQAAALESELALARAFKSQDVELWKQIPRRAVQELLAGLVIWARADASHNPSVAVPSSLSSRAYVYSWSGLRLEELLLWTLAGAFTEEERKALASGW